MLYITPLVLTYLTGKSVSFDCFYPILPPTTPASSNHKSDLFFYVFVCFESIIDLQHYVSSWRTA